MRCGILLHWGHRTVVEYQGLMALQIQPGFAKFLYRNEVECNITYCVTVTCADTWINLMAAYETVTESSEMSPLLMAV